MGLFKCKHKKYRIMVCDAKADKYYVKCVNCGEGWWKPKAVGEQYNIGQVIG